VVFKLYSCYAKALTPFPFKHLWELLLRVTYYKKRYVDCHLQTEKYVKQFAEIHN